MLNLNASAGLVTASSTTTFTNKTLSSAANSFIIPTNNNADTNLVTINGTTLEYRTVSSLPTGFTVSSAPGAVAPVYAAGASTSSSAIINGLSSNSAQGFSLTTAPPVTGGNIVINNNFLNQDVRTTASPTFAAATIAALTTSGSMQLSNGPSASVGVNALMYDGVSTPFTIKPVTDLSTAQTLLNKTLTSPVITGAPYVTDASHGRVYSATFSGTWNSNASGIVYTFTLPDQVTRQSVSASVEANLYDTVAHVSAYVRQTRTFEYIAATSCSTTYTSVNIWDKPSSGTGAAMLSQLAGGVSPGVINVFVQNNNTNLVRYVLNLTFIVYN